MNLKFGKLFIIVIIGLKFTQFIWGYPIVSYINDILNLGFSFNLPQNAILMLELSDIISILPQLIIVMWYYFQMNKLIQDKWTWGLLGLFYDSYILILLILILIIQNINIQYDLNKSVRNLLVLILLPKLSDLLLKQQRNPCLTNC